MKARAVAPILPIQRKLLAADRIMVITHIDPDGDALGTQLAFGRYLKDLGKRVFLIRDSEIPDKYLFLPGVGEIISVDDLSEEPEIDTLLILECPSLERAGRAARFAGDDVTIISIDHHQGSAEVGEINWLDLETSSVGEMTYEYFCSVGYDIPPEVAVQLYTALMTDTGRFRYQSTSPRTMVIAGELINLGADPRMICDNVYFNMRPSTMILTGKVLSTMEFHDHGRICLLTLTREMLREAGADESESDGLVDFSLYTRGVVAGALLKEISENETKISLRSTNGVNVGEIAAHLDGGGHVNAAGCRMALPLEKARVELIKILGEANAASRE